MYDEHTPNYASLFLGNRPAPFHPSRYPDVMKPVQGIGYTSVIISYTELFDIRFYAREKLFDALFEHAVACVNERNDYLAGRDFTKSKSRVLFMPDGIHVFLHLDDPILTQELGQ